MEQTQQNRRAMLVVEDDAELRCLAARLLEDSKLDTIECESAEAALATMLIRGREEPASRWVRIRHGALFVVAPERPDTVRVLRELR